jgi:hypothetical protein
MTNSFIRIAILMLGAVGLAFGVSAVQSQAEPLHGYNYRAEPRSVVMLYGYLI